MNIPDILLVTVIIGGLIGFVLLSLPSFSCRADAYMSFRIRNKWLKELLRLERRRDKINTCGDKRQLTLHKFEDAKKAIEGVEYAIRFDRDSWEGTIRPYSEDFVRKVLRKHGIHNVKVTHYEVDDSCIVVKL